MINKMATNDISLQLVYGSIHSDSFRDVDFTNLHDSYYVGMSDRGVYFEDSECSEYLPLGTISRENMLFVKEMCQR